MSSSLEITFTFAPSTIDHFVPGLHKVQADENLIEKLRRMFAVLQFITFENILYAKPAHRLHKEKNFVVCRSLLRGYFNITMQKYLG